MHDEGDGFDLVALGVERQQSGPAIHEDHLDRQDFDDGDLLAVREDIGQRVRGARLFETAALHDGAQGDAAVHRLALGLFEVVLKGDHLRHPHRGHEGAHLLPRLALHGEEPAPDRRRAGEHFHWRVRLGGAVPFRQVADERLDPVQRGTAGFEERTEGENGRGGAVTDSPVAVFGAGESAFHEEAERADDAVRRGPGAARAAGSLSGRSTRSR